MTVGNPFSTQRLRIVVMGFIVRKPLGGQAWHYLQYVLGLSLLGHDVYYIEDGCWFENDEREWYYHPISGVIDNDPSDGLSFINAAFDRLGIPERWAHRDVKTGNWIGPASSLIAEVFRSADMLINVSGSNPLREDLLSIPLRVYLDTDPVYSQIWIETNEVRHKLALQHNVFFTFGENIHKEDGKFPTAGLKWFPTRQPIVVDCWPISTPPKETRLTTVMAWEGYTQNTLYNGKKLGCKAETFAPYLNFPRKNNLYCELALFRSDAPSQLLLDGGWIIKDGNKLCIDPWSYRNYIQGSTAEFSVAKEGYVISSSGWFSERSACYLASGRPVVLQDTGYSSVLPSGYGLLSFHDPDSAKNSIESLLSYYDRHCKSARDLAENFFSYKLILPRLIEKAFAYA